ncbi:MAG TPA: hypothetical protein PKY96_15710, partial [Flavobacteriales bacterium]|nr:hypothetical protein [Flavobacteriales bacterium]
MKRLAIVPIILVVGALHAQTPGSVDPAFNPSDIGYGRGDGFYGYLSCGTTQADGKVLVGGDFTGYSGLGGGTTTIGLKRLARLNADGTLDQSLAIGSGFNAGTVRKILVQADGMIIALGDFTSYNGTAAVGIARLTSTGAIDPTFISGTGFTGGYPEDAVLQPDGKIAVVGTFTAYNGSACGKVARLNADGGFDATFVTGTGFTGSGVNAIALQTDGSFVLGGGFTAYNGTARGNIVRISSTGAIDAAYHPGGVGMDDGVQDIAIQTDGKAVVVGSFVNAGGVYKRSAARLFSTGAVDATFDPGTGPDSHVTDVAITSAGQVLIAGFFSTVNGIARAHFARLTSTGAVDATFVVNEGTDYPVRGIALQTDGKAVILGPFVRYNGWLRQGIARVNTNGSMDTGFFTGGGVSLEPGWIARVNAIAVQPDGKALVGGLFQGYNDRPASGLVRVNANGTLDATFNTGTTDIVVAVNALAVQPDGRVLAGGAYSFTGSTSQSITRFTSTGALDATFLSGAGFTGDVRALALQPDGRILVAGNMSAYNGTACRRVVRLNANGTLDATFNTGTGPDAQVNAIALLPDGSLVIGGSFTQVNGNARGGLARLQSDGSLDPVFPSGAGTSGYHLGSTFPHVESIVAMPDGRLLVGGDFTHVHGIDRSCIARLLSTGAVDATFDPGYGANQTVTSLALQPDGKVVVGGKFTNMNWANRHMLCRLNLDGSLDGNYPVQIGIGAGIWALARLTDGDVLAGGEFTELNDVGRNRLARVNGGDVSVSVSVRAFLQGPYDNTTQTMSDALRATSLLPAIEPYSASGYDHVAGGGGGSVLPAVLAITGSNAIVDHVVVELRNAATPGTVLATQSALIQRDGDVVAMDGTAPVTLYAAPGNYHVALRHRNHLGVMTSASLPLTSATTTVDFTLVGTPTFGTNAHVQIGSRMALWAGDATGNGIVQYVGNGNDRDPILIAIGGSTPTNT